MKNIIGFFRKKRKIKNKESEKEDKITKTNPLGQSFEISKNNDAISIEFISNYKKIYELQSRFIVIENKFEIINELSEFLEDLDKSQDEKKEMFFDINRKLYHLLDENQKKLLMDKFISSQMNVLTKNKKIKGSYDKPKDNGMLSDPRY